MAADQKTASRALTNNKHLLRWVEKMADLTQPAEIHWVDGSEQENETLCRRLVQAGTFFELDETLWPGCYYARSSPNDVARVEDRTYICSLSRDNAGPTNNWEDPFAMRKRLKELFRGSMRGRTMYVLPFSMGPIGSPLSQIGVQLTDSAYAVVNMRIMTRIGAKVFAEIVPCADARAHFSTESQALFTKLEALKSVGHLGDCEARATIQDYCDDATHAFQFRSVDVTVGREPDSSTFGFKHFDSFTWNFDDNGNLMTFPEASFKLSDDHVDYTYHEEGGAYYQTYLHWENGHIHQLEFQILNDQHGQIEHLMCM